jgi:short-subunit dehydrogenase
LAFSDEYDFEALSDAEILNMVQVNISSCLLHLKAILPNLRQSTHGKIILIGSTWGLENHQGKEVVFSACKFAVRGMVHALRENLRTDKIGISVLNLGYLATEYGLDVPVEDVLAKSDESLIPLTDVIAAIRFILSTSRATCVKEINMPAMLDMNA